MSIDKLEQVYDTGINPSPAIKRRCALFVTHNGCTGAISPLDEDDNPDAQPIVDWMAEIFEGAKHVANTLNVPRVSIYISVEDYDSLRLTGCPLSPLIPDDGSHT